MKVYANYRYAEVKLVLILTSLLLVPVLVNKCLGI